VLRRSDRHAIEYPPGEIKLLKRMVPLKNLSLRRGFLASRTVPNGMLKFVHGIEIKFLRWGGEGDGF
jgi:hypothetical protein